ncbi:MAG: preprotein translocase subunit SecY [Maricaulaceae bacterium]
MRTITKATELHKRLWFTLGALVVYRLGTFVPVPGVRRDVFEQAFQSQAGGVLGMVNTFAGGAVERMAIFALNVMPYITASIIMQILSTTIPRLEALKKEGEAGRKQINQYTRYLTVLLATVQAFGITQGLMATTSTADGITQSAVINPGFSFIFTAVVTLVGGTMFLMWLGEQVTARGVGNGISLIIFAGIVAELPRGVVQALSVSQEQANAMLPIGIGLLAAAVILAVVFMERSQRRLLVQYPKRQVGNRMFGGQQSFLPLKINTAGVIPPIFASTLLLMPATLASFQQQSGPDWVRVIQAQLGPGQPVFMALYAALIIGFCFFYTSIVFNPEDTADNLRKHGGFLPGIRPGRNTASYLDYVLTRLTVIGSVYLTIVCLLPEFLVGQANIPFRIGGTSLLIVVSVTMDTVSQIQSHLLAHQYEGLIKKTKLRGRRR